MVLMLMMGVSETLAAKGDDTFPNIIPVPDGFYPEGIAVGRGTDFFVGSMLDGDIYRGDLRTGEGAVLVQKEVLDGDIAVGLAVDRRTNYLFVAGGFGTARVYDAGTGGDPGQARDSVEIGRNGNGGPGRRGLFSAERAARGQKPPGHARRGPGHFRAGKVL